MVTFLSVLVLASAIAIIVAVVLQEGGDGAADAYTGGSSDSVWGSNKGNSKDAVLSKITLIAGVVFMVSLVLIARF
ncbi:MAG: preprotein translocase subunit SecG [Tissierellia bacterium]|nr:preprotein translocase subunit SecG [Tissierellia bacterium]